MSGRPIKRTLREQLAVQMPFGQYNCHRIRFIEFNPTLS